MSFTLNTSQIKELQNALAENHEIKLNIDEMKEALKGEKFLDADDVLDKLIDEVDEDLLDAEFIYYGSALEYLADNDPSLEISMGLAYDFGYTKINSCLLASLLKADTVREEVIETINSIIN